MTYDATDLAEFAADAKLDERVPLFPEPQTRTVLAQDLRAGDVLVSAALGGVWDAAIRAVRIIGSEVFLGFAGADPVCLEVNEVCEARR